MEDPPIGWYLPGKMGFSWAMLVSGSVIFKKFILIPFHSFTTAFSRGKVPPPTVGMDETSLEVLFELSPFSSQPKTHAPLLGWNFSPSFVWIITLIPRKVGIFWLMFFSGKYRQISHLHVDFSLITLMTTLLALCVPWDRKLSNWRIWSWKKHLSYWRKTKINHKRNVTVFNHFIGRKHMNSVDIFWRDNE